MPFTNQEQEAKIEYLRTLREYYVWMRLSGFLPTQGTRLPAVWSSSEERNRFMELDKRLHTLEVELKLDDVDLAYMNHECQALTANLI